MTEEAARWLLACGGEHDFGPKASSPAAYSRKLWSRATARAQAALPPDAAGVLIDGETVVALRKRVGHVEGTLHAVGGVTVNETRYGSLSAAAKAVSGTTSEPGPEYWAVRRDEGLVSVFELRRRFDNGDTPR